MKLSDTKSELHKVKGCIIKNIQKVNRELWQDLRGGTSYCDLSEIFTTHLSLPFLPALYGSNHCCWLGLGKLLPRVQMFLSVHLGKLVLSKFHKTGSQTRLDKTRKKKNKAQSNLENEAWVFLSQLLSSSFLFPSVCSSQRLKLERLKAKLVGRHVFHLQENPSIWKFSGVVWSCQKCLLLSVLLRKQSSEFFGYQSLKSRLSVMSNFLWLHGLKPVRLLCPWDFPGKNVGVGCHFLFQGVFLTQGSNLGLPHCRQTLYHLSHQGSPQSLKAP